MQTNDEESMEDEEFEGSDAVQGATRRVYLGIMRDLEVRRLVPGQRLIETDLASRYNVGRNAVREAMQRLSGRGIIDLSPNRSPSIRSLDAAEVNDILDVAAAMTGLLARTAAGKFHRSEHAPLLDEAIARIKRLDKSADSRTFGKARRGFYRAMLMISANRELHRLFPSIGMHIIYSQLQSHELVAIRVTDYGQIAEAIAAGDQRAAERAAQKHVENVRNIAAGSALFDN